MKKIIHTSEVPEAIGPYSQANQFQNMLYVSGQIPLDKDGHLVDGDIASKTEQVMKNLGEVLKAAGSDFSNILKCTIFITDMNNFAEVNKVYGSFFKDNYPARETVEVSRLPKDVPVEISCIAYIP